LSVSDTVIRCRGLVKRYEKLVAVDGIDLDIARGECFGLLGPNGAGKTTTVEVLEGLLEPDAGEVEILGRTWREGGRALREHIGVQLQESKFIEKLTVLETVRLFRSFYARGPSPEEVVALVQLEEKAGVWVRKLSGGQRQRLSLACALVCDPDVLFLDEPTTGLDPQSRLQMWEMVTEFRRRGRTVLLTTHYMEEAERLCDRVAIMDHGKIISLDTPARLVASLGARHVVEFEVAGELEENRLAGLEGVTAVGRENGVWRLTVSEVHRALPALLDELRRDQQALSRLTTHHATLEDVFVSLTGRHLRES
jgi:ABC-2 type transport system ATP-binding protein